MNRRLYRSRTDTVLGGVAAGLADYLNADPALVRLAWAILVPVTGGAALLAYIVGWVVIPEAPRGAPEAAAAAGTSDGSAETATGDTAWTPGDARVSEPARGNGNAGLIVGIGLVLLGLWFLLREYVPQLDWGLIWPIILIGIGGLILVTSSRRRA